MKELTFGSVCSGIEAASVAWEPLGLRPLWFAEIEPFPSRVLAARWPDVPNLGDMTAIEARILSREVAAPDVLVGGTPCQSFSVAGLGASLDDPRGQLSLAFVRLANAIDAVRLADGKPPAFILWENVPGVLNKEDNPFGCILGGLVGSSDALVPRGRWTSSGVADGPSRCAAWRVLDAQFFGLAQRRERIFVLARGGARERWTAPDALLPLIESLRWHPEPSREAREGAAARTEAGAGGGSVVPEVAGTITPGAHPGSHNGQDAYNDLLIPVPRAVAFRGREGGAAAELGDDLAFTLRTGGGGGDKPHALVPVAFKASHYTREKDGAPSVICPPLTADADKGDQDPLLLVPFDTTQITHRENRSNPQSGDPSRTLAKAGHPPAIAIQSVNTPRQKAQNGIGISEPDAPMFTVTARDRHAVAFSIVPESGQGADLRASEVTVATTITAEEAKSIDRGIRIVDRPWRVRRLTPMECERLQGFPDGHTAIGKDSPRYKAIGNSMATRVMRWIGQQILEAA